MPIRKPSCSRIATNNPGLLSRVNSPVVGFDSQRAANVEEDEVNVSYVRHRSFLCKPVGWLAFSQIAKNEFLVASGIR